LDTLSSSIEVLEMIFDWRALLDIILVAVGLCFLCRTILRLGTWKIVSGTFIALLVFAAANLLDLKLIEWIYSNVSHVAVIAIIVVFQPEIRKVFERAASLKRTGVVKGGSDLAMVLVDAVFALAQKRRGAIVVFPGKEPLKEWLSGGLLLDANPTFPLIMSIFDPNSPGHDGALIVDRGKLTYFAVRLPISKRDSLSEEFGTRHFAAMGLSEVSDALVLVVSEERGAITLFQGGRAVMANDKSKVIEKITSHWDTSASLRVEMRKGKKRWNLASQMAVSLVLAVVLWSTVIIAQGEIREKVLLVPVEYVATPEHLALVGEKPTDIKLHLTGPKSDLHEAIPSQLAVKIDLSKAMPGKQTFPITSENVKLPKQVKLLEAAPPSLTLSLVEIIKKDVLVKPQLVGKLPAGVRLKSIEVIPQKIRVLSPSDVEKEKEVVLMTTPIYLENLRESSRIFCKIIAPPGLQPTEKRWPDVEVFVTIARQ
jgi:uncharacterized protein (TIGR00159 family)